MLKLANSPCGTNHAGCLLRSARIGRPAWLNRRCNRLGSTALPSTLCTIGLLNWLPNAARHLSTLRCPCCLIPWGILAVILPSAGGNAVRPVRSFRASFVLRTLALSTAPDPNHGRDPRRLDEASCHRARSVVFVVVNDLLQDLGAARRHPYPFAACSETLLRRCHAQFLARDPQGFS
jgi:hypothetical protein